MSTFVRKRKTKTVDKLAKQVRKNTRILNQREINFVRTSLDATPDTTAVVQNVSLIAQGLDDNDRVGRKIHAMKIEIAGIVEKHTSANFSSYRIVCFRDNLGTTTAPTRGDLFESEDDFFDCKPRTHNEQALKRFTFLWDKKIVLNEQFDGNVMARHVNFTKKLNFDVTYTGAATTDEGKNSIWIISGSDEATNVPGVNIDCMLTYSDL